MHESIIKNLFGLPTLTRKSRLPDINFCNHPVKKHFFNENSSSLKNVV